MSHNTTTFAALIANIAPIVAEHTVIIVTKSGKERPALRDEGGKQVHRLVMAYLEAWQPGQVAQPPLYPFVGEKAVRAKLQTADRDVLKAVALMMWSLQTESERAERDTDERNKAGFMSSDAWTGSVIAERIALGGELTAEQLAWVTDRACSGRGMRGYAKQLSVQLRSAAIANDPRLASIAAQFSIR